MTTEYDPVAAVLTGTRYHHRSGVKIGLLTFYMYLLQDLGHLL